MGWGGARLPGVSDLGSLGDSIHGYVKRGYRRRKRSILAAGGPPEPR